LAGTVLQLYLVLAIAKFADPVPDDIHDLWMQGLKDGSVCREPRGNLLEVL
jgi:hypothetical protein